MWKSTGQKKNPINLTEVQGSVPVLTLGKCEHYLNKIQTCPIRINCIIVKKYESAFLTCISNCSS